jgi:hypothetical protein
MMIAITDLLDRDQAVLGAGFQSLNISEPHTRHRAIAAMGRSYKNCHDRSAATGGRRRLAWRSAKIE